ncbi:hypothetical protein, partial [Aquabacterium sp.]|uniref:hypothetical protein n=1 Tax=Aquabacterium sp. TaxID=1872578 RepID=UPI002CE1CBBA
MTRLRTLRSAILCASALLPTLFPFGAAHAVSVVTYTGYASADNFDSFNRLQDTDNGTTIAPASYGVNVDGNVSTSITDSVQGGTAYSYASSAGAYSMGVLIGGVASSSATVSYRVTVVGPDLPASIPVRVVASGYVNGAGSTQASATFVLNPQTSDPLLIGSTSLTSPAGNSFSFDQVVRIRANGFFDVSLYTSTLSGGVGAGAGWSEAFVDPIFTIDDPAYASLYHFEGIPGITASVPEPAS